MVRYHQKPIKIDLNATGGAKKSILAKNHKRTYYPDIKNSLKKPFYSPFNLGEFNSPLIRFIRLNGIYNSLNLINQEVLRIKLNTLLPNQAEFALKTGGIMLKKSALSMPYPSPKSGLVYIIFWGFFGVFLELRRGRGLKAYKSGL